MSGDPSRLWAVVGFVATCAFVVTWPIWPLVGRVVKYRSRNAPTR